MCLASFHSLCPFQFSIENESLSLESHRTMDQWIYSLYVRVVYIERYMANSISSKWGKKLIDFSRASSMNSRPKLAFIKIFFQVWQSFS